VNAFVALLTSLYLIAFYIRQIFYIINPNFVISIFFKPSGKNARITKNKKGFFFDGEINFGIRR